MTTSTKAEQPVALEDPRTPFLRAIRESPEDDTPRLVYADWLQENDGDVECSACRGKRLRFTRCAVCHSTGFVPNNYAERAEFIRVQCELAKLRAAGCHEGETCNVTGPCAECNRDVLAEPLRQREAHLFVAQNIPELPDHGAFCYPIRGFYASTQLYWHTWLTHHAAILSHPDVVLEKVRLTTMPDDDWWAKETDLPAIGSGHIQDSHIADVLSDRFRDPLAPNRRISFKLPGECE